MMVYVSCDLCKLGEMEMGRDVQIEERGTEVIVWV